MRNLPRPNSPGFKMAVVAALCSFIGTAVAHTTETPSETGTTTSKPKVEHDHQHPLPTTHEIPIRLPNLPSTPHPSASKAQGAQLPQK